MTKQVILPNPNPTRDGACNWSNRVKASWSKVAPLPARVEAPTGLRFHAARLQEEGKGR